MKKLIFLLTIISAIFLFVTPVYAQSADVSSIQTFVQNIIQILVTLAGLLSVLFFIIGGIGYITSSGNPQSLEKSKRTIIWSAIGLTIVLASFFLSNVVTQLATHAFGTGH